MYVRALERALRRGRVRAQRRPPECLPERDPEIRSVRTPETDPVREQKRWMERNCGMSAGAQPGAHPENWSAAGAQLERSWSAAGAQLERSWSAAELEHCHLDRNPECKSGLPAEPQTGAQLRKLKRNAAGAQPRMLWCKCQFNDICIMQNVITTFSMNR